MEKDDFCRKNEGGHVGRGRERGNFVFVFIT